MNKIIRICNYCLKKYEQCPNCEDTGVFRWRLKYCCVECFKKAILEGDKNMRVQFDGVVYNVKEDGFKSGDYVLLNHKGKEFVVNDEDDLWQGIILDKDDYSKLKYGRFTKSSKNKEEKVEE